MRSIRHMLFFLNILTIHQDALSLYTLECARGRGSEPESVPWGFLPLLTPPAGKRGRDSWSASGYRHQRLLPSQGHLSHICVVSSQRVTRRVYFSSLGPCFTSPHVFYYFVPALYNYHVEILKCI